jgi:SAM-dependent methyltransferase
MQCGRARRILLVCLLTMLSATPVTAQRSTVAVPPPHLDVPYVSTPQSVVEAMLRLAQVTAQDRLYDLGCGDGRIVITAALQFGARGLGVDLDPERIAEAQENARQAGVAQRVRFVEQDLFATDLREATVVTLYLLPQVNLQLRPMLLQELRPGVRVVSHDFDMDDWPPDRTVRVDGSPLYLWVIPAQVAGTWTWQEATTAQSYTLQFTQHFQQVDGTLETPKESIPLEQVELVGDQIRFLALLHLHDQLLRLTFTGRVQGNTIVGQIAVPTARQPQRWVAQRTAKE